LCIQELYRGFAQPQNNPSHHTKLENKNEKVFRVVSYSNTLISRKKREPTIPFSRALEGAGRASGSTVIR